MVEMLKIARFSKLYRKRKRSEICRSAESVWQFTAMNEETKDLQCDKSRIQVDRISSNFKTFMQRKHQKNFGIGTKT